MSTGMLDTALSYTAGGISILPMQDKQPHGGLLPKDVNDKIVWTPYQLAIAPVSTLREWFGPANAMAAICGQVSGNLAALDFDIRDGYDVYKDYLHLIQMLDPDLANLPLECSPSGGRHVFFRAKEEVTSALLAQTPEHKTLIELKGRGECLNCAPTYRYTQQVSSLLSVPTISNQQLSNLLRICRSLSKVLPPQKAQKNDPKDGPAARFDASHTTSDMLGWLTDAGWKQAATTNGVVYLTRPGKDRGVSGTLGWNGLPIFRNFSANSGFEIQAYGAFGLWSALKHDGNHSAAATAVLRSEPVQHPQFLRDMSEPIVRWDDVPGTNGAHHEESKGEEEAPPKQETPEKKGYRLLDIDMIWNMTAPRELIADWVLKAPTALLYAKAGAGKTFLAMDMALCIASGKPWHGHEVMQGSVIYIAAEGAYGMGQRAKAWCLGNNEGNKVSGFYVIPHPIFPTWDETFGKLKDTILENAVTGLQAIFIDTLAQCFGEGNESDNHDSQMFLSAVGAIAQEHQATVFLVHHEGWDGSRLRGASNFRNSIDTVIQLKEEEGTNNFTIRHDKIKDLEQAKPMRFERVKVGPNKDDSCYVRVIQAGKGATANLTQHQRTLLETMVTPSLNGTNASSLIAASGLSPSSFYKVLGELARGNMVTSTGEERSKTRTHTITEGGRRALSMRF